MEFEFFVISVVVQIKCVFPFDFFILSSIAFTVVLDLSNNSVLSYQAKLHTIFTAVKNSIKIISS